MIQTYSTSENNSNCMNQNCQLKSTIDIACGSVIYLVAWNNCFVAIFLNLLFNHVTNRLIINISLKVGIQINKYFKLFENDQWNEVNMTTAVSALSGGVWRADVRAHWLMMSGACCGGGCGDRM